MTKSNVHPKYLIPVAPELLSIAIGVRDRELERMVEIEKVSEREKRKKEKDPPKNHC